MATLNVTVIFTFSLEWVFFIPGRQPTHSQLSCNIETLFLQLTHVCIDNAFKQQQCLNNNSSSSSEADSVDEAVPEDEVVPDEDEADETKRRDGNPSPSSVDL